MPPTGACNRIVHCSIIGRTVETASRPWDLAMKMRPLRYLQNAWHRFAGTTVFVRRRLDPRTGAWNLVTYRAVPIPGTDDFEVSVRTAGFFGQTESSEIWDAGRLDRLRERVVAGVRQHC